MAPPIDPLDLNVVISEQERDNGELSPENVRLGTLLLNTRGYVILEGAVPESLVAELRSSFGELYDDTLHDHRSGRPRIAPGSVHNLAASVFWERALRFRIFPKLTGPFASTYVLRNPFAHAIIAETLGGDYYCKSVSSDTCVKGSVRQAPHRDIGFYDNDDRPGCLVNIPLMHCGPHNGPLQVWPGGSHLWRSAEFTKYQLHLFTQDGPNPAVEAFASHIPSKLIELRPGELMIRDPGMLHRGTPNPTDQPRTMLTAGYFRSDYYYRYGDPWYNLDEKLYSELEPSVQQLFAPFFDTADWRYELLRHEHCADGSRMGRFSR